MAASSEEASNAGDEHGPGAKADPGLPTAKVPESNIVDVTEIDEGRAFAFFVNPPPRSNRHSPTNGSGGDQSEAVQNSATVDADLIERALRALESKMRTAGPLLSNPQAVRDFLRLKIASLERSAGCSDKSCGARTK